MLLSSEQLGREIPKCGCLPAGPIVLASARAGGALGPGQKGPSRLSPDQVSPPHPPGQRKVKEDCLPVLPPVPPAFPGRSYAFTGLSTHYCLGPGPVPAFCSGQSWPRGDMACSHILAVGPWIPLACPLCPPPVPCAHPCLHPMHMHMPCAHIPRPTLYAYTPGPPPQAPHPTSQHIPQALTPCPTPHILVYTPHLRPHTPYPRSHSPYPIPQAPQHLWPQTSSLTYLPLLPASWPHLQHLLQPSAPPLNSCGPLLPHRRAGVLGDAVVEGSAVSGAPWNRPRRDPTHRCPGVSHKACLPHSPTMRRGRGGQGTLGECLRLAPLIKSTRLQLPLLLGAPALH